MKIHSRLTVWVALLCFLPALLRTTAEPQPNYGSIEILRDPWGVPHVFSATDRGALYGLGYAAAEERGFQMTYSLRLIQGRLAEVIGDRSKPDGRETALEHDRKMRTFGWAVGARRTAQNLDGDTRQLLDAYCEGVNDSFAAQRKSGRLHPLFKRFELEPEPWTPADCLLSWWHLAQFFATDGTRDLMAWRNRSRPQPGREQPPRERESWRDDAAAVVQRADVSDEWVRRVQEFCAAHGLSPAEAQGNAPKFSHAWVVGRKKSGTGAAVLVSDPQTPVRNPSLWMEFHISGQTFNTRGVGVPGSPGLLIGFNERVAWGLTALGADQADLFRLETSPEHPNQYRWDDQWRPMQVRREVIQVKDGASETLEVRETHLGPVVSAYSFRQEGDPEVALKRVPMCEPNRDTIQGVFAMMRARNAVEFGRALGDWRFPSANCVYGDADGQVGFSVLGAIPVRAKTADDRTGGEALAGTGDAADWTGFVPAELLPQVVNPKEGHLLSANHRPIGAFYNIPLGTSTGSMGDTVRSWRLRERLTAKDQLSPQEVLAIHYDSVNPARREIVRVAEHVRKTDPDRLSVSARQALEVLERWRRAGASSDLGAEDADLATRISTFFRFVATPLALQYGGGESGLARFLKETGARIDADPQVKLEPDACAFLDKVLSDALGQGGEPAMRPTVRRALPLGWFDSLDGFGSLDRQEDIVPKGITNLDGQTIRSQNAQSYTQWVPLHDVDGARTVCPIGHSDRPGSRYRASTLSLWQEGQLHPAPLTRQGVEKLGVEKVRLN